MPIPCQPQYPHFILSCFPLTLDNSETERKLTCFVLEQKSDKVSVFKSFLLKCEHTLTPPRSVSPRSAPAVTGISFQKQSSLLTTSLTILSWSTILKPVLFQKSFVDDQGILFLGRHPLWSYAICCVQKRGECWEERRGGMGRRSEHITDVRQGTDFSMHRTL